MAQHQQSGAASSQELYGELESINELLESVDDDIAAILAEIADEEAQSGHIPVLDDIVARDEPPASGALTSSALESLDIQLQATPAEPANEDRDVNDSRAARAVISAVYREEQTEQRDDMLAPGNHSAVTFSGDDFVDLADDGIADTNVTVPVETQDAPRAVDPLDAWLDGRRPTPAREPVEDRQPAPAIDPEVLAECTAEVVTGIVEEWLPVLREELSRRLGEAIGKAVASTAAQH